MCAGKTVAEMRCIIRKSFFGMMKNVGLFALFADKNSRLIQIVPKAGDTFGEMIFVLFAKPRPRLRVGKIGKSRFSRPRALV